jgi:hypothetical protein
MEKSFRLNRENKQSQRSCIKYIQKCLLDAEKKRHEVCLHILTVRYDVGRVIYFCSLMSPTQYIICDTYAHVREEKVEHVNIYFAKKK